MTDRVRAFYGGKSALMIGATGFLGKPLIEKLLRDAPELRRVYVLIRSKNDGRGREIGAQERFDEEILASGVFGRLRQEWGVDFHAHVSEKVAVVSGDIEKERLGLADADYAELVESVRVVINSAAVVVFDSPLDKALDMNAIAPRRVVEFAQNCRDATLVHISTAYVNGRNPDLGPETLLPTEDTRPNGWRGPTLPDDLDGEIDELQAVCRKIDAELTLLNFPETKNHLGDAESARKRARRDRLVQAGMDQAHKRGWNDTYTYTKALGEQAVAQTRGDLPTAIVRPSIIESSLYEPDPGWIDGFRMADPIIVAYGKGRLPDFPLNPDAISDLIPVDFVVNATLCAAVETAKQGGLRVYQVGTGTRNPINYREVCQWTRAFFRAVPMLDKSGLPIPAPTFTFPEIGQYQRALRRKLRAVRVATRLMGALPFKAAKRLRLKLNTLRTAGERLLYYTVIYGPYIQRSYRFDTSKTQQLLEALTDDERTRWGFDVSRIDWRTYFLETHIPGLKRNVLKMSSDADHVTRPTANPGALDDDRNAEVRPLDAN